MRTFFSKKSNSSTPFPLNDKNNDILLYEKLKESEIRYRRLFESAKDGILILDFENGNIIDANPYIVKMIDFPLAKILGKKLWEIGLFSNKEESEKAFIELKANGYIRFEDMPIQKQDGTITEVEFVSNVYLVSHTKVIQCNIRDITQRKRSEIALIESEQNLKKQNDEYSRLNMEYLTLNQELTKSINHIQSINDELICAKVKAEESDKLKSAFLANMSHEIRTPMNAIMGFAGFLLQPELSKEKLENFVQIINSCCQQLLSVISDIIDISKIETGQITVDLELFNVNNLLNELWVTYKKIIIERKNLSLNYCSDCSRGDIMVNSDGNRIRQVFCNLLNNSIKFTKEGKIEFGYKIKRDFIEFYVKDTGIGIAPENNTLIFQRFRQIKTDGHVYGGNGLGLSISQALVEKLGGTMAIDSALGRGSTFTFTIPYNGEKENNVSAILAAESAEQLINWEGNTVLVVEDEINNHSYIEELLSIANVQMIHAWNGKEAVEQIKKQAEITLVLMDIKMPIMDGYEALRLIKKIRPKLPVIAQTAYALSHDRDMAMKAGFDNYLAKPIPRDLFLEVLDIYLGG